MKRGTVSRSLCLKVNVDCDDSKSKTEVRQGIVSYAAKPMDDDCGPRREVRAKKCGTGHPKGSNIAVIRSMSEQREVLG
jgi:hypothetical protein